MSKRGESQYGNSNDTKEYYRKYYEANKHEYNKKCHTSKKESGYFERNKEKIAAYMKDYKLRVQPRHAKINSERQRDWIWAYRTSIGCHCCYETDPTCLDFHHIDPDTKKYAIAYMIGRESDELILDEIAKCIILCSNCHRKHHRGSLSLIISASNITL